MDYGVVLRITVLMLDHDADILGTTVCRTFLGLLMTRQEDPECCPSNTVGCLEVHIHLFVDGVQKLHIGDQLRWRLRIWDGLTDKFPVARTVSFLNIDVDFRSNLRETKCPYVSLCGSISQTPGVFLFKA